MAGPTAAESLIKAAAAREGAREGGGARKDGKGGRQHRAAAAGSEPCRPAEGPEVAGARSGWAPAERLQLAGDEDGAAGRPEGCPRLAEPSRL